MSLIINIYYTGTNGSARKFAEEMVSSGIVDRVRYELKMRVERFTEFENK